MADETYTALTSIGPPGSMVFGYRRGDEVASDVVDAWGLVVGEHVTTDPADAEADASTPPVRPGPEDTLSTWQAYAVSRGMDADKADSADMEELQAYADKADAPAPSGSEKAAPRKRTAAKTTDRPAGEPVGDPVAMSATESTNG